jgi:8-oxo-dGTP pyrophosphatase MutT (NUDIX family)
MYKVFNQNKTIFFTQSVNNLVLSDQDCLTEVVDEIKMMNEYLEFIKKDTFLNLIIYNKKDVMPFFKSFLSHFKIIEAAGGLIRNSKNELLMIFRLEKWDLPKGKIEKGESVREAAIRECEEETGVKGLSIIKELENTYHVYTLKEKPILKQTYWFEMFTNEVSSLTPQIEEDITEVKWMSKERVQVALKNTYASLSSLIEENL